MKTNGSHPRHPNPIRACLLLACAAALPTHAQENALLRHLGMCDASAGIALNASTFCVANDEDNVIRLYAAHHGGLPIARLDLNRFLDVVGAEKPETDFEGATWFGDDTIFWITSHGRNKEGKYRPSRHRFFATLVNTNATIPRLSPTGNYYRFLVHDLASDPRLKPFHLLAASTLPPKAPGALNIEGLCATPDGQLLIGFRNPIPKGKALLVPLLNPKELIRGHSARFDNPILLDLDGRGIRDIARWRDGYLVIGGRHDGGGKSRLYQWGGPGTAPRRIKSLKLHGINPEAIIAYPAPDQDVQLLSDDGTEEVGGIPCKELSSDLAKSFRSIRLTTAQLIAH